jgi:SAM-dependent methyltransferase
MTPGILHNRLREGVALDVGCGLRKIEPDAVGIDVSPDAKADITWNLNQYPWPLEPDTFARVHMSHIIEHLDDIVGAMKEAHRVARDRADVYIVTPHFSSHNSYTDPTHKHHLAAASFEYFTNRSFESFVGPRCGFELVTVELTFGGNLILDNLGRLIAAQSLKWYERHAAWIFPALDIRAHLRVIK